MIPTTSYTALREPQGLQLFIHVLRGRYDLSGLSGCALPSAGECGKAQMPSGPSLRESDSDASTCMGSPPGDSHVSGLQAIL